MIKLKIVRVVLFFILVVWGNSQATSASPIWSGSKLYQSNTITVASPAKSGNVGYTYATAFSGSTLYVCFGFLSMKQTSQGSNLLISITNGMGKSSTGGTLTYAIGSTTSITAFSARYLAIDGSVKEISTYEGVNLYSLSSCK